jgi:hypothetical protein
VDFDMLNKNQGNANCQNPEVFWCATACSKSSAAMAFIPVAEGVVQSSCMLLQLVPAVV